MLSVGAVLDYEHRLTNLGATFAACGLAPVLVKGQAVVDVAYGSSKARLASDVDLLAAEDESAIAATLLSIGYTERDRSDRPLTRGLTERQFLRAPRGFPRLIELHTRLDKHLRRPIDYAGIRARSRPSPRPGFRYPAPEDQFLLLVLSESVSQLSAQRKTEDDLRLLLANGKADMGVISARAKQWGLERELRRQLAWINSPTSIDTDPRIHHGIEYLVRQVFRHDRRVRASLHMAKYIAARVAERIIVSRGRHAGAVDVAEALSSALSKTDSPD